MSWLGLKSTDKVLVMMSGGLESSVAAQRVLTETDAELFAVNIHGPHPWHQHERRALAHIIPYLQKFRDFKFSTFACDWPANPSICHLVHFVAGTFIRDNQEITHWVRTAKFAGEDRHVRRKLHSTAIFRDVLYWEADNTEIDCTVIDPFDGLWKHEIMNMAGDFILINFASCHGSPNGHCGTCPKCREREAGLVALASNI